MTFPSKPNPIKDPEAVIVMRQYRKALDAREDELMKEMARRWLEIELRLDADISALAYEMTRRAEAGERITQQMAWRNERYKVIRAQMEEQIRIYSRDYAVDAISKAQLETGTLGIRSAQDSIFQSFGPMGGQFDRIGIEAVKSGIGFAGDGSPLYKLLKNDYPDAVNGLLRSLINGVARGQGPAQTARDMANGMGMGLERATLIARTETARMYRNASTEQYRQSGVTSGFQRLVKKETACLACLALDGQLFEVADDFYDHPRGKCMMIPIIEGVTPSRWQTGPEWFDTLDPQEQEARLGPTRYQLWKDGQIQFSDLATIQHNDTWGSSPQVATIKDLTGVAYSPRKAATVERKTPTYVFQEATTIKEANAYAVNILGLDANYNGVDLKLANEWNAGLSEYFNKYPELRDNFQATGSTTFSVSKARKVFYEQYINDPNSYARKQLGLSGKELEAVARSVSRSEIVNTSSKAMAFSTDEAWEKYEVRGIFINKKYSFDDITNISVRDVNSGFHPIGCNIPKSVLDHEMGHQIDDLLGISKNESIKDAFVSFSRGGGEGLSKYAAEGGISEFVAEGWAEYMNNPEPRLIAKQIGELIESEYKKVKK